MTAHLQRRKNAKAMRAEADAIERRRFAATIKKLRALKRKGAVVGAEPGIWDDDIALLTRAIEPPTNKRGPPLQLVGFHRWIAAHFLWLRKSSEIEDALFAVGEAWGVSSRTTIEKAVRAHGAAALQLLAALGSDPMPNIVIMADAYKALARP
jgi:hypothetical protein